MRTFVAALFASALLTPCVEAAKNSSDYFVYVGTYTRENSKGIYAFRFHPADGKLEPLGLAAAVTGSG